MSHTGITKPVEPEWEAIAKGIVDDLASEGIELLIPVIPWEDEDEDLEVKEEPIAKNYDMEEYREKYKSDLELMKGVYDHNHCLRELHSNRAFFENLKNSQFICPNAQAISVIHVLETSLSEFKQKHIINSDGNNRGLPALIKGIPEHEKWLAWERWSSIERLLSNYGHVPIKVTEIPPIHGMGKPYPIRLPLALYKEYADTTLADGPFYGFEYDFADSRVAFLKDYSIPKYFQEDFFDHDELMRKFYPNNRHLIIGGERTGTNLHFDPKGTSAWNTLLVGRKKWALFPPGTDMDYIQKIRSRTCQSGTAPGGPVGYWWEDSAPVVPEGTGMIECIQEPGDTIFVPGGWWHCVINLEFSMAITQNWLPPQSLPSVWAQIKKDWPKFALYVETKSPKSLEGVPGFDPTTIPLSLDLEEDDDALLEFHLTQTQ